MKKYVQIIQYVALIGLLISAFLHLYALQNGGDVKSFWFMHIAIFLVLGPIIIYASREREDEIDLNQLLKSQTLYKTAILYLLFAYAGINFFDVLELGTNLSEESNDLRMVSGHWMLFYCLGYIMNNSYVSSSDSPVS